MQTISRFVLLLALSLVLIQCGGSKNTSAERPLNKDQVAGQLDISDLGEGTEIKASGLQLMDLDLGMTQLHKGNQENDSVLVILVHGYQSEGYEWVSGVNGLVDHYGSVYFFRYDWDLCADEIAVELAEQTKKLKQVGNYEKVLLFGHSYGGLVLTFAASQLEKMDSELHVIAAPLTGFPRLMDECQDVTYDKMDRLVYPTWSDQVKVIQHKTVHAQDGAFRELATDPQDIDLPFNAIQDLPPTMDGHRLGHNWSVTWVVDSFLGRPHRH